MFWYLRESNRNTSIHFGGFPKKTRCTQSPARPPPRASSAPAPPPRASRGVLRARTATARRAAKALDPPPWSRRGSGCWSFTRDRKTAYPLQGGGGVFLIGGDSFSFRWTSLIYKWGWFNQGSTFPEGLHPLQLWTDKGREGWGGPHVGLLKTGVCPKKWLSVRFPFNHTTMGPPIGTMRMCLLS